MISLNVVVLLALMPFLSADLSAPLCTYNNAPNAPFLTCNIKFSKGDSSKIEANIPDGYTKEKVTKIKIPTGKASFNTFPAGLCNEFPNLEELGLSGVGLRTINKDLLKNCTKLKVLDVSNNLGIEIQADLFSNNPGLQSLDLSKNYLQLPGALFKDLTELRSLSLSTNYAYGVPNDFFINNGKLESLFLNSAGSLARNAEVFKSLVNLKKLSLANSRNNIIAADKFGVLKNLEYLDLSSCRVKAIDRNFIANSNITTLKMEGENWCFTGTWTRAQGSNLLEYCFNLFDSQNFPGNWY